MPSQFEIHAHTATGADMPRQIKYWNIECERAQRKVKNWNAERQIQIIVVEISSGTANNTANGKRLGNKLKNDKKKENRKKTNKNVKGKIM